MFISQELYVCLAFAFQSCIEYAYAFVSCIEHAINIVSWILSYIEHAFILYRIC